MKRNKALKQTKDELCSQRQRLFCRRDKASYNRQEIRKASETSQWLTDFLKGRNMLPSTNSIGLHLQLRSRTLSFSTWTKRYALSEVIFSLFNEELISRFHPQKGQPHVLAVDLGCGTGQHTRLIAPHFKEVVGIDISDFQVEEARAVPGYTNITYRYAEVRCRCKCSPANSEILFVCETSSKLS